MEKFYLLEGEDSLLKGSDYWRRHCWICELFATSLEENQKGVYLPGNIFDGEDIIGHLEQLLMRDVGNEFVFDEVLPISHMDSVRPLFNPLTRDEISYAFVQHILLPNNFRIVYASYQGAPTASFAVQGSHSEETKVYTYPDVIALSPVGVTDFHVLLARSFGADDEAPYCFYASAEYIASLKASLVVSGVINKGTEFSEALVGVAYDDSPSTVVCWDLCATDFMFRTERRQHWSFGIWRRELRNVILSLQGSFIVPARLTQ